MKSDNQKTKESSLELIVPGKHLRLRDGVYRYMQTRKWIFGRVERDERILLVHERGGFGLNVKVNDIDWEAYRKGQIG